MIFGIFDGYRTSTSQMSLFMGMFEMNLNVHFFLTRNNIVEYDEDSLLSLEGKIGGTT